MEEQQFGEQPESEDEFGSEQTQPEGEFGGETTESQGESGETNGAESGRFTREEDPAMSEGESESAPFGSET